MTSSARPRKDSLVRRLALAKLRELRRTGMTYREITERFALQRGAGEAERPQGFRFRLPPERLLQPSPVPAGEDLGGMEDRALFLRALDALETGLAFFTCAGELLHANRPYARALENGAGGQRLWAETQNFAEALCSLVELRGLAEDEVVEDLGSRALPGDEGGTHRLRGSYIGLDLFGRGNTLLMTLEPPRPEPLSDEELRRRFGLSNKQSRIARLLVEGGTNQEIANRLFLSPHTARHHTEHIFRKLGARSRTEAVSRLLRTDSM